MIIVKSISKSFSGHRALSDVSLKFHKNELVAIVGPSGCGKSTLLRCINNLVPIDSGEIHFGTTTISPGVQLSGIKAEVLRREIGMVFQSLNLWPYRTALQNIIEGAVYSKGMKKKAAIEVARQWAERLGIDDQLSKYPCQLSGGQKQRVAICRAIVMDPGFLLLDEITASLDPVLAGQVAEMLVQLKGDGLGIVIVTHQLDFARQSADRVVFMENGTVAEVGLNDILAEPKTERLQRFIELVRKGR